MATVGVLGALPLSYTGSVFFWTTLPFPGFEPGTFIPKSHFIDQRLNRYTTASFQRISLKCIVVCAYIKHVENTIEILFHTASATPPPNKNN